MSGNPTEDAALAGDAPLSNGSDVELQADLAPAPVADGGLVSDASSIAEPDALVSVDATPIDGGAID
jgi:hypothetical protein